MVWRLAKCTRNGVYASARRISIESDPEIAQYMNTAPTLVASRTMTDAAWHITEAPRQDLRRGKSPSHPGSSHPRGDLLLPSGDQRGGAELTVTVGIDAARPFSVQGDGERRKPVSPLTG